MAKSSDPLIHNGELPRHISIIMDGNGRWAKKRALPRSAGHIAGVENVRAIIRASKDFGIEYLTLYAFSTENWSRPDDEVSFLMKLIVEYLRRDIAELHREGVRMRLIGDEARLPADVRRAIDDACELTKNNTAMCVNFAINYGARAELVHAVRAIAGEGLTADDIDETAISAHLYTAGQPDPDLIIRTSGEMRISNFLLYQAAYAEFYFTGLYWPDFSRERYADAINDYMSRGRRFGGV